MKILTAIFTVLATSYSTFAASPVQQTNDGFVLVPKDEATNIYRALFEQTDKISELSCQVRGAGRYKIGGNWFSINLREHDLYRKQDGQPIFKIIGENMQVVGSGNLQGPYSSYYLAILDSSSQKFLRIQFIEHTSLVGRKEENVGSVAAPNYQSFPIADERTTVTDCSP